jgi:hypothetical protein
VIALHLMSPHLTASHVLTLHCPNAAHAIGANENQGLNHFENVFLISVLSKLSFDLSHCEPHWSKS